MAHFAGIGCQSVANQRVGFEAGNHLHHLHQRNRVEKVESGQAGGMIHSRGQRGDRERRCVACNQRLGPEQDFQLGKQVLFDVQLFHDGFNDQIAGTKVAQRLRACQARGQGLALIGRQAAFVVQLVPLLANRLLGGPRRCRRGVENSDLAASLRRYLSNAAPHGASPYDSHMSKSNAHDFIITDWRTAGFPVCQPKSGISLDVKVVSSKQQCAAIFERESSQNYRIQCEP